MEPGETREEVGWGVGDGKLEKGGTWLRFAEVSYVVRWGFWSRYLYLTGGGGDGLTLQGERA